VVVLQQPRVWFAAGSACRGMEGLARELMQPSTSELVASSSAIGQPNDLPAELMVTRGDDSSPRDLPGEGLMEDGHQIGTTAAATAQQTAVYVGYLHRSGLAVIPLLPNNTITGICLPQGFRLSE
jgi:hypothetical protein